MPDEGTPACRSIGAVGKWRTPRKATPTPIGEPSIRRRTNVPGYFNLKPGDKYLDPFESPRNNNWYLLTLGARRGLTFLEQQPEVDADWLGVYGHSMGGNLTVYVAGADNRVKAAAPSVGGSGFRTEPWPLLPQERRETPNGDVKLFNATIGFESYAPHIKAPLLWLGATNDFHGIMDDTYRTGELIPHKNVRYSFTPHMNHRFTPEFAVTRPLWFDQYLKSELHLPDDAGHRSWYLPTTTTFLNCRSRPIRRSRWPRFTSTTRSIPIHERDSGGQPRRTKREERGRPSCRSSPSISPSSLSPMSFTG